MNKAINPSESKVNSKACESTDEGEIINVWKYNLEEEVENVCKFIEEGFDIIAMDTEFPGIIYNLNPQMTHSNSWYDIVRDNVNVLNMIQVGITLSDKDGNKPKPVNTWQFNMQFDLSKDKFSNDSITILKEAGIDFDELKVLPLLLTILYCYLSLLYSNKV